LRKREREEKKNKRLLARRGEVVDGSDPAARGKREEKKTLRILEGKEGSVAFEVDE